MSDELVELSHAIVDAFRRTGLNTEQMIEACMGFAMDERERAARMEGGLQWHGSV